MDYTEMKKAVDIVDYIGRFALLKQIPNGEFVSLCPLHHEDTPSFFVNRQKQQFVCMGCGVGGDIITFIQHYHHVNFEQAVKILQYESGVVPHETPSIVKEGRKYQREEKCGAERLYLLDNCMDEFPESHEITEWIEEGISLDVLRRYNVRYGRNKDRIYFPIWDLNGRIITVKYRNLRLQPKYMHTTKIGRKDFLYNLNFAMKHIEDAGECIIFEGEKSVMKMETWGIKNSVAVGTHFIKEEIPLLIRTKCKDIVFAYDSDVGFNEIRAQSEVLKHYKNVYYVPTKLLGEKEAPCDRGKDFWLKLYESRLRVN